MPSGSLLQLSAHGVQDIYLIGNPQFSFFKSVYRRHTNFVMESILGTLDGTTDFGNRLVCKLPRSGDLVNGVVLEIDLPELVGSGADDDNSIRYISNVGHAIIDYVELHIGGQLIDKQYGEWMHIWNELSQTDPKKRALHSMVKTDSRNGPTTLIIPLEFWFCRHIGSALPLIALQYHDVEIVIQLRPLSQLYNFGPIRYYNLSDGGSVATPYEYIRSKGLVFSPSVAGKTLVYPGGSQTITYVDPDTISVPIALTTAQLDRVYIDPEYTLVGKPKFRGMRIFMDYIFLDTYERKQFAQAQHRYLIEQLQFSGDQGITASQSAFRLPLNFNLPVKELFWLIQTDENLTRNNLMDFRNTPDEYYQLPSDVLDNLTIQFNGIDRFQSRRGEYFRLLHQYQHHTNPVPDLYIYTYSFAINPEELQPSGSANFSKIDNVDLIVNLVNGHLDSRIRVYGINYNVLRIMNGMGGVAFST